MNIKALDGQRREGTWDAIHMGSILFILLCYLFFLLSPIHDYKVAGLVLNPMAVALLSVTAYRAQGRIPLKVWPSLAFTLWYYVVHALNGNTYLLIFRSDIHWGGVLIAWVLFFTAPMGLCAEKRGKWLFAFGHIYAVCMGGLAWAGLAGLWRGNPFSSPFTGLPIGWEGGRLKLFHIHPNFAATMMLIAMGLTIYLLCLGVARRGLQWLLRGLYGVILLGTYLFIALTDSRTVFIMAAMVAGMLVFQLCWRGKRIHGLPMRLGMGAVGMAAAFLLVFFSFSIVSGAVKPFMDKERGGSPAQGVAMALREDPPPVDEVRDAVKTTEKSHGQRQQPGEARPIVSDISTLTGRTQIYRLLGDMLRERPETLWKGTLPDAAMEWISQRTGNRGLVNMHNSLLQALLITGIPGALLAICFLITLMAASLRIFFAAPGSVDFSAQVLVALAAALVVNGITESYLFTENNVVNLVFFFVSGAVVANDYQKGMASL